MTTDERAVRLALEVGAARAEIEHLRATIERLEIEKHDLAEKLAEVEQQQWRGGGS